jgi:hypothetical protein
MVVRGQFHASAALSPRRLGMPQGGLDAVEKRKSIPLAGGYSEVVL